MKMKKAFLIVVAAMLAMAGLAGCTGPRKKARADNAKKLVNKILRDDLGDMAAKCLKVEITEKIDKEHYRGVASLDNGNDLKVLIEDNSVQMTVTLVYDEETSSTATMRYSRKRRRSRIELLEQLFD